MTREIYEDYTDQIEPFGLDENWLDVTGSVGIFGSPMTIAQEISNRVKFELGITCSIGVANNKVTAKLGSDYKKPDAITRIEQDNYKEIVCPLPVEDLLYVGPATSNKLRSLGISTIGRLAQAPADTLTRKLGKMGTVLQTFALGLDRSPVRKSDHIPSIKSVGNSATTPRDMTCDSDVELNMFCRQRKLQVPTRSSYEIAHTACRLFRQNYRWTRSLRSLGVRGCGLVEATAGTQLSLYPEDQARDKWERMDVAVDRLRQRYGYQCIQRASLFTDPLLGAINPRDDHTVHPIGYFE